MEDRLMRVLLGHARYSFADIGWSFEQLNDAEKCLIGSQDVLDEIRRRSDAISIAGQEGAEEKRS